MSSGIIIPIMTTMSVVMTTVPEKIIINIGNIWSGFISLDTTSIFFLYESFLYFFSLLPSHPTT